MAIGRSILIESQKPTEGIRHEQPNTVLFVNSNNIGQGTLYITESFVMWLSENDKGITFPYPNIILHAISRDLSRFPHECIYVHTDVEIPGLIRDEEPDEDNEMDSCPQVTVLYFVPDDKDSLSAIFDALASCQALHPDPQDQVFSEEEYEDYEDYVMYGASSRFANMQLSSNGANGNAMDDSAEMDPECFEDAEDADPEQ